MLAVVPVAGLARGAGSCPSTPNHPLGRLLSASLSLGVTGSTTGRCLEGWPQEDNAHEGHRGREGGTGGERGEADTSSLFTFNKKGEKLEKGRMRRGGTEEISRFLRTRGGKKSDEAYKSGLCRETVQSKT